MKNFQKLNESLFDAIPNTKLETIKGGYGTSLTCITSTGPCDCTDSKDID